MKTIEILKLNVDKIFTINRLRGMLRKVSLIEYDREKIEVFEKFEESYHGSSFRSCQYSQVDNFRL